MVVLTRVSQCSMEWQCHHRPILKVSKKGRANGDFIMHRECGISVDLNQATGRAVGKMKTTITQRFNWDGIEFDIDCDNRFFNFCQKTPEGEWKIVYYKVIYEKDRVVPVDGHSVPKFDEKDLNKYPYGYRHLGVAQAKLGHNSAFQCSSIAKCFVNRRPRHERHAQRLFRKRGDHQLGPLQW